MNEAQETRHVGRSIFAVLAGTVVGAALSLGTDVGLHATGIFPPIGQWRSSTLFAIATGYRTIYNMVGSYVMARLAPTRPMAHALVGGTLGLAVSTIGAVATWNRGPGFGPHWYPISLAVLALPCAWVGAKVRLMQSRSLPKT